MTGVHAANDGGPGEAGLVVRAVDHVCRTLDGRISAISVFGSRAGGDARPDSDLDLAVLPCEPLDPVALWDLAQEVAALVHCEVDLVDLWRASTVLQHQIVIHGQWVYLGDEGVCDLFEANTLTRYGHLNEERREILEDMALRRREGENPGG